MQVNLELYRIFFIVANCGSLTAAANQLFISQPAISQSIKQLETQLGGQLFTRTNKGMELTNNGSVMYEYIKQANTYIDMAEKKFRDLEELKIGSLNIGASDTIVKHYLYETIKNFHGKYPDIIFNIMNRTSADIVNLIRAGKLDVGVVTLPIDAPHLDIVETFSVTDCFIANRKIIKNYPNALTMEEIAKAPLILLEQKSNARKLLDEYFAMHSISLVPQMELASIDLVVEFAKLGIGIGLGTREFLQSEFNLGEIVEIPTEFEMPKRTLGLVTLKGAPLSFAANQFISMMTKNRK